MPIRFYMDVGVFENESMDPRNGPAGSIASQLVANQRLRDVLRSKGNVVYYSEFNGGHEYVDWRGTFGDALAALSGEH